MHPLRPPTHTCRPVCSRNCLPWQSCPGRTCASRRRSCLPSCPAASWRPFRRRQLAEVRTARAAATQRWSWWSAASLAAAPARSLWKPCRLVRRWCCCTACRPCSLHPSLPHVLASRLCRPQAARPDPCPLVPSQAASALPPCGRCICRRGRPAGGAVQRPCAAAGSCGLSRQFGCQGGCCHSSPPGSAPPVIRSGCCALAPDVRSRACPGQARGSARFAPACSRAVLPLPARSPPSHRAPATLAFPAAV